MITQFEGNSGMVQWWQHKQSQQNCKYTLNVVSHEPTRPPTTVPIPLPYSSTYVQQKLRWFIPSVYQRHHAFSPYVGVLEVLRHTREQEGPFPVCRIAAPPVTRVALRVPFLSQGHRGMVAVPRAAERRTIESLSHGEYYNRHRREDPKLRQYYYRYVLINNDNLGMWLCPVRHKKKQK